MFTDTEDVSQRKRTFNIGEATWECFVRREDAIVSHSWLDFSMVPAHRKPGRSFVNLPKV